MRKKFAVRANWRIDRKLDLWSRRAAEANGQDVSALWRAMVYDALRKQYGHLEPTAEDLQRQDAEQA